MHIKLDIYNFIIITGWIPLLVDDGYIQTHCQKNKKIKRAEQILPEVYRTTLNSLGTVNCKL
jgi:hypothetical protein